MKSAVVLSLAGSALAVPFGNVIDAMFGTAHEGGEQRPRPDNMPNFPPLGTGTGCGFPFPTGGPGFPTGTGAFPIPSGGMNAQPFPFPGRTKTLSIDYQLAPTAAPEKRQVSEPALPSFTLVPTGGAPGVPRPTPSGGEGLPGFPVPSGIPEVPSPSDIPEVPSPSDAPELPSPSDFPGFPIPSGTPELPSPSGSPEAPFPIPSNGPGAPSGSFPTGGFPAPTGGFPAPTGGFPSPTGGFPSPPGGFPGTNIPGLPTTLATRTRGPRPTGQPSFPGSPGGNDDGEQSQGESSGNAFWEWLQGLFGGGRGEVTN